MSVCHLVLSLRDARRVDTCLRRCGERLAVEINETCPCPAVPAVLPCPAVPAVLPCPAVPAVPSLHCRPSSAALHRRPCSAALHRRPCSAALPRHVAVPSLLLSSQHRPCCCPHIAVPAAVLTAPSLHHSRFRAPL